MLFVLAVVLGVTLGLIVPYNLTSDTLPYVAVAIIAALDSVFGGVVANISKRFSIQVFMTGLISNAILAVILTYVGNMLGINLSFAVIVVFGVRLFNNLANIRRSVVDSYFIKKIKLRTNEAYIGIESGPNIGTDENSDIQNHDVDASSENETDEKEASDTAENDNVENGEEKEL